MESVTKEVVNMARNYNSARKSTGSSRSYSPARAHQHVGQSFGGYTKARSSSTGNFYMTPDSSSRKRK